MRVSKKRTVAVAAAAVLAVAALGGVAVATGTVPVGDDLDRPGSITVDERALPDNDAAERDALAALATVDQEAATAAALEAVGGEAVQAELEDEDGYVVWEVLVRASDGTATEVTVDAGDAGVLRSERSDDDDDDGDRTELRAPGTVAVDELTLPDSDAVERDALTALAKIDQAAAGDAAVTSVGGGEAVRAELEEEAGFVVWDVLVRAGDGSWREVTVDAGDARVLGTDLDDDEDD